MQKFTRLVPLFTVLAVSLFPSLECWARDDATNVTPIEIEADRMETSRQGGRVQFSGSITARQGNLVIHADEMTVVYGAIPSPAAGVPEAEQETLPGNIEKILARGNVKVAHEGWTATGDAMDYNAAARVATLTGSAKAWQDQNVVSGETIVLYLDEGKSVVKKSGREGERVKALIYPAGAEKNGGDR